MSRSINIRCYSCTFVSLMLASMICGLSYAQPQGIRFEGGMGLTLTAYDRALARSTRLVSQSVGAQGVFTPYFLDRLLLHMELGLGYVGPLCLDVSGDEEGCTLERPLRDKDTGLAFSAALGTGLVGPDIRFPGEIPFAVALGLIAGQEWYTAQIAPLGCEGCVWSDADLGGGRFLEPGLFVGLEHGIRLGIFYRWYEPRADLRGRLTMRLLSSSS